MLKYGGILNTETDVLHENSVYFYIEARRNRGIRRGQLTNSGTQLVSDGSNEPLFSIFFHGQKPRGLLPVEKYMKTDATLASSETIAQG